MAPSTLLYALVAASVACAQSTTSAFFTKDPLVNKVIPFNAIPYQVMTDIGPRGPQYGYNQCNSTTENQHSLCQTMFINHLDDFCMWAPDKPGSEIGSTEGEEVAWCTKKGHGTRLIPAGAITSMQMIRTPSYIQLSGSINQAMLNIGGQYGGELDSGGQDGEGNPMGGLVYSNAFPSNNGQNGSYQQVQHWSFFIGNNQFCGKACDQTGAIPGKLCNNVYDRLGCDYNAPAVVQPNTFEICDGADMTPVGIYVVNGVTSTFVQPFDPTPMPTPLPYTATPAASSNCRQFASTDLFTDLVSVTAAAQPSGASGVATPSSAAPGSSITSKPSGASSAGSASPSGSAKAGNGAAAVGVSVMGVIGALAGMLIL